MALVGVSEQRRLAVDFAENALSRVAATGAQHMTLDGSHITSLHIPQHEPARSLDTSAVSCGSRHGPRWHCAWTKQGREQQAATSIAAAGFESYLPLHLERDGWKHVVIGPLFPRYVFARFSAEHDNWGCIPNLRGVCGLIRHGYDAPTPIPNYAIDELLARTSSRGIVDDPGERPYDGPGAGYRPVWQDMTGLDAGARLRLLLRLFGASVTRQVVGEDAA
jgi:transcription antitermination factor NusG